MANNQRHNTVVGSAIQRNSLALDSTSGRQRNSLAVEAANSALQRNSIAVDNLQGRVDNQPWGGGQEDGARPGGFSPRHGGHTLERNR